MNKYTALWGNGNRMLSVGAQNQAEANEKIDEQLKRPGRYDAYNRWHADGCMLLTEDNLVISDTVSEQVFIDLKARLQVILTEPFTDKTIQEARGILERLIPCLHH